MAEAELDPWVRIIRWPFAVLFPFAVLGLWFNDWLTRADQVVASVGFLLLWALTIFRSFTARGQAWAAGPHRKRWADRRTGWLMAVWTLGMMVGELLIPLTDSTRGRGVPFPWEDPAQLPESWRS